MRLKTYTGKRVVRGSEEGRVFSFLAKSASLVDVILNERYIYIYIFYFYIIEERHFSTRKAARGLLRNCYY